MKPLTIIAVDDHPLFRQGVEDVLSFVQGFLLITQASDEIFVSDLLRVEI
jgi:DNA-binding NarL/FixJ family response regulator